MTTLRVSPSDIRVGDLIEGRRVTSLERTRNGVVVVLVGKNRELYRDGLIDVNRPDRVRIQALVQATAIG